MPDNKIEPQPPRSSIERQSQAAAKQAIARFMTEIHPHQSFLVTGQSERTPKVAEQSIKDWQSSWVEASKSKE